MYLRTCNFFQDEIYGSAYAAAVYISSVIKLPKDKKVYVIGQAGLEEELQDEGIVYIGGTVSLELACAYGKFTCGFARIRLIIRWLPSIWPISLWILT